MRALKFARLLCIAEVLAAARPGLGHAMDSHPQSSPPVYSSAKPPCEGLLCVLTPNSMARPITAPEAAQMEKAAVVAIAFSEKLKKQRLSASARPHKVVVSTRRGSPQVRLQINPHFVQFVAAKNVGSIQDLAGKPVSLGAPGSKGQAVGRNVLAALGIKIEETPLDLDNALDGAATGEVAAILISDDADAARLRALASTDLHLLSVPAAFKAPEGMKATILPATATPSWAHGKPIRTFAFDRYPVRPISRKIASN